MRHSTDFTSVVRSGVRASGGPVIVHHRVCAGASRPPLVGFVVSKAVGNSVTRHRVTRRLRAQAAQRLVQLPAGSATVVRALPGCAQATSTQLGTALDKAFARLTRAAERGTSGTDRDLTTRRREAR